MTLLGLITFVVNILLILFKSNLKIMIREQIMSVVDEKASISVENRFLICFHFDLNFNCSPKQYL